jgi:hypothetical protein
MSRADRETLFVLAQYERFAAEGGTRSATKALGVTRSAATKARLDRDLGRYPIRGFGRLVMARVAAQYGDRPGAFDQAVQNWWEVAGRFECRPKRLHEFLREIDAVEGLREWIAGSDLALPELPRFLESLREQPGYTRHDEAIDFGAALADVRMPKQGRRSRAELAAEQGPAPKKVTFEKP